jgi:hypothetical protein
MNFTRITKTRPLAITINIITYTLASKGAQTIAPTLLGKIIPEGMWAAIRSCSSTFHHCKRTDFLDFF